MSDMTPSLTTGVPRETLDGESRVALVPATAQALIKQGYQVQIETGAGLAAGYLDEAYTNAGATIVSNRSELFSNSDIILQVRAAGANSDNYSQDLDLLSSGKVVIAHCEPLAEPEAFRGYADKGVTLFALELLPRITRAQSMDVLSSMATIAGYKAVLIAANALPRMFPMMMTAAGTLKPAKVFIIGAGVAGLQAIATAKRLGAVVSAYDLRPAVKEQVESLGGKFVEMELDTGTSEQKGGYAKEMGEEFYRKQREMMSKVIAESDVVITTAAVPGKKSPILVTAEMVQGMKPGTVIVDLACEKGGNCELTVNGQTIDSNGVKIIGPKNITSTIPDHASEMYSKNITTFLKNLVADGAVNINMEDEIIADTLITREGEIVQPRVREILGMTAAETVTEESAPVETSTSETSPSETNDERTSE
ncbi:NAD(P) transhydrogenase subunit alpha part 1 [Polystyrenella longa]|uniref:NAD(P) transhydrogenase subunit alpha part 1 n=1 Tax=Polystyrenella longa TaxID=2528007 RepID=A0A518CGF9_9PLAN|nr:Re/Si-specific NAD(P)(+) transhydrogenase subunit alpha [Polystyrenella longa]QDU78313.1 NAD(P) transhydrogenase subunit alpha part 1 [Polystyrenella longa]